ncbi:MAG: ABC transporter substrate-binding protein [Bacteroidaceae bacterium]
MRRILTSFIIISVFLLSACGGKEYAYLSNAQPTDSLTFRYASLIRYYHYPRYDVAEVRNPWDTTTVLHRYVLVPRSSILPDSLPKGTLIRTPLQRAVAFSSVHCGLLDQLKTLHAIVGVCDVPYVLLPTVLKGVSNGSIRNMGSSLSPDVERILAVKADGLLVSPYEKCNFSILEKTRLPVIECADYMETSAMGRAEWMRFYGRLFGRAAQADSLFIEVERRYNAIKKMVRKQQAPSLLVDRIDGAVWYVPGGHSTMGRIFQDAGANYLFANFKKNGSVPLSFEQVYQTARNADIWVMKYGQKVDLTYTALSKEDRYCQFDAYKHRRVYGCNTDHVPFYEEAPFRPDVLLRDIMHVLYPSLFPPNEPYRFYLPLNE